MNDYFEYLNMDSNFMPSYPNDKLYKKNNMEKSIYPYNMMNLQNQNNINNMMNINDNCGLLNSTEGTLRGNMFPNLYDPYKNEGQKRFIPTSEKEEKLFDLQKTNFAMVDINLYLDTNPNDTCMINLYNKYLKEYERKLNEFENKFGPITCDSKNLEGTPWIWLKTKWPWEGGK